MPKTVKKNYGGASHEKDDAQRGQENCYGAFCAWRLSGADRRIFRIIPAYGRRNGHSAVRDCRPFFFLQVPVLRKIS